MKQQIEKDYIQAFKEKKTLIKNTLGIVKTKISEWEKSNPGRVISDSDCLNIFLSEIKKRRQSITIMEKNSNPQAQLNIENEKFEILLLEKYLPKPLSNDELKMELDSYKNTNPTYNQGQIMGHFNKNFKGRYDNKDLLELLK